MATASDNEYSGSNTQSITQGLSGVTETWAAVPGWPYEVSTLGNVRRKSGTYYRTGAARQWGNKNLVGGTCGPGRRYRIVLLQRHDPITGELQSRPFSRHRIVAQAFLGPCPPGYQVNHKDSNPANNRVSNLEYVTGSQNILHAVANGKWAVGEKRWNARLTADIVREMRLRYKDGVSVTEIARSYSANLSTVYHVVKRRNWRHVA